MNENTKKVIFVISVALIGSLAILCIPFFFRYLL